MFETVEALGQMLSSKLDRHDAVRTQHHPVFTCLEPGKLALVGEHGVDQDLVLTHLQQDARIPDLCDLHGNGVVWGTLQGLGCCTGKYDVLRSEGTRWPVRLRLFPNGTVSALGR